MTESGRDANFGMASAPQIGTAAAHSRATALFSVVYVSSTAEHGDGSAQHL
jgi:hypothetical protein